MWPSERYLYPKRNRRIPSKDQIRYKTHTEDFCYPVEIARLPYQAKDHRQTKTTQAQCRFCFQAKDFFCHNAFSGNVPLFENCQDYFSGVAQPGWFFDFSLVALGVVVKLGAVFGNEDFWYQACCQVRILHGLLLC